jgi:hypothetical protein
MRRQGDSLTNRRGFISQLIRIAVARPDIAFAQPAPRIYRIGCLHPTNAQDLGYVSMMRALGELGYVAG